MWALGQDNGGSVESEAVVNIKATLKTREQLQAEFDHWKAFGTKAGDIGTVALRGDAEEYMNVALLEYGKSRDWPVTGNWRKDAENIAAGWSSQALRSQGVPISISPEHFNDLESAAVNISSAAVTYTTGVDPRLAQVTVQSFSDAELSESEMQAICAVAGSIAGAAVGQMFGIPAPIGAWVGGIVGDTIGGVVSDMFGLGIAADRAERWRREKERLARQLEAMRQQANNGCSYARISYWMAFDGVLRTLEEQWQRLECEAGRRFDLRWFDRTGTYQFSFNRHHTKAVSCEGGTRYCCPYVYGCPYPRPTPQGAGALDRVASAFAARGFPWPPCDNRPFCNLKKWKEPTGVPGYVRQDQIEAYKARLQQAYATGITGPADLALGGPGPQYAALDKITVMIAGDLIQTAGAVKAELDVMRERGELAKGLSARYQEARAELLARAKRARLYNGLLNYGALAVGAGVLGYAIKKRR